MKLFVLAFIIPLALGLTFQEDDLVFDDVSDDSQPISSASPLINQPPELYQPQPPQSQSHPSTGSKIIESTSQSPFPEANVTTTVGHVFRFKVPKHAFGGSVNHYEVSGHCFSGSIWRSASWVGDIFPICMTWKIFRLLDIKIYRNK